MKGCGFGFRVVSIRHYLSEGFWFRVLGLVFLSLRHSLSEGCWFRVLGLGVLSIRHRGVGSTSVLLLIMGAGSLSGIRVPLTEGLSFLYCRGLNHLQRLLFRGGGVQYTIAALGTTKQDTSITNPDP